MRRNDRSMAVELSPLGILVNCIAPGLSIPNVFCGADNDPDPEAACPGTHAARRLGVAEDIANMVSFLVSDESAYTTGQ